jgi:hypothetical protein
LEYFIVNPIPKYMSLKTSILSAVAVMLSFIACNKNPVTPPPVHDTVTVIKTDTLKIQQKIDTPDLKTGLVLYLPFNGSFADSSGLGNVVTAEGGAALDYDMHGYAQSAFSSTGAGERLVVANNGSYKVDTAFSVSMDVMIRSNAYYSGGYDFSGLMSFVSIVNTTNGNGPTFNCGLTTPGLPQYFNFGVNPSTSDCAASGAGNPQALDDTTGFIPQVGSWYNVICTFTKGSSAVYVNGKLVYTKKGTLSSVLFCPDARFVIGGWWDGNLALENLRGKLDEVRFYKRTLNAQQIAWLARNFQPTSTKLNPVVKTN